MYVSNFNGLGTALPPIGFGKFKGKLSPTDQARNQIRVIATKIALARIKEASTKGYAVVLKAAQDAAWAYVLELQERQQTSTTTRTLISPIMSRTASDALVKETVDMAIRQGPPAEKPRLQVPEEVTVLPVTVTPEEAAIQAEIDAKAKLPMQLILGGVVVGAAVLYFFLKK